MFVELVFATGRDNLYAKHGVNMNLIEDRYSVGDVAEAAGIPVETLKTWLARGVLIGGGDPAGQIERGGKAGVHRRFTFATVMEVAVAAALMRGDAMGRDAAFKVAAPFAYSSVDACPYEGCTRQRAFPFPANHGATFIRVRFGGDGLRTDRIASGRNGWVLKAAVMESLRSDDLVIFLDASKVFRRVCEVFEVDPDATMAEVYRVPQ